MSKLPAFLAATLLLFVVLTPVMTYPQILHLRDGVNDAGDPLLVTWVFAWVAHQLPYAPAHLFDANIFYPERRTLAFAETMLVPALTVAPLQWLGVERILIYNLSFLSGFVLSGVGTALLVRSLTGHRGAAIVAAVIFAFLPYRIDQYPHLQLQQAQWIPLSMWALHSLLCTGRVRDGVWLGVCVGCQLLSCVYYGLFLIPYMAVVGGVLLILPDGAGPRWRGIDAKALCMGLLVAAAIVCVAVVPVGLAYLEARRVVGDRTLQEIVDGSATWRSYLAAPSVNLIYGKAFARFVRPESVLFPGFVPLALALVTLLPGRVVGRRTAHDKPRTTNDERRTPNDERRTSNAEPRTAFAYAIGLLFAFDMSLGVNGLTYRALYEYVLPFRALRVPARMGVMVGFSLAVLAGFAVARIASALKSPRARRLVPALCCALILTEYASWPMRITIVPRTAPETYADLLRDRDNGPPAVVFEFPMTPDDDPTYMYYSTFHWQLLVNGFSGFFPESYVNFFNEMARFPQDPSLDAIKRRGVNYVVVHGERLKKWRDNPQLLMRRLADQRQLALVSRRPWQGSEISLYRVVYP